MMKISEISIENTTICGADCVMCPRHDFHYPVEEMPLDLFRRCIQECDEHDVKTIALTGFGDPLMDTHFEKRCMLIREALPDTKITITTTCHAANEKNIRTICQYVDEVLISMYGITKVSYESIHRGILQFEKVKNNIDQLLNEKKRPYIVMKYLLLDNNKDELEQWKQYYEKKADRIDIWKPHSFGGRWNVNNMTEKKYSKCFRISSLNGLTIRTNGDVSMCCMDYNHELVLGNLKCTTLEDVLTGQIVKGMQQMNEDGSIVRYGICQNCDQLFDRTDALVYSSDKQMKTGENSHTRGLMKG